MATLPRALLRFADDLPPLDELFLADELLRPDELFPLVLADERERDDDEPDELRLPVVLLLPLLADERPPDEDDDFPPPLVFLPDELLPDELLPDELLPDDERDELLCLPPLDLELELRDEPELRFPDVDREPDERPPLVDAADRPDEVIVSAAAPTAPTAAPVAAPLRISPATSITLSTIAAPVERLDREELLFDEPVLLLDPDEEDRFAMCFLPKKCS